MVGLRADSICSVGIETARERGRSSAGVFGGAVSAVAAGREGRDGVVRAFEAGSR